MRLKNRLAFTLVELTFAIVILGVVAVIGSRVILQTYESYIIQKAQHRVDMKLQLALNQIANRLKYAIVPTVGVRLSLYASFTPIAFNTNSDTKVLQWVGYDNDGFEARSAYSKLPGWSGFCDVENSDKNNIQTPGSSLIVAKRTIINLGGYTSRMSISFVGSNHPEKMHRIKSTTASKIILSDPIGSGEFITERYKLAWTSYAIELDRSKNLILHYRFSPFTGEKIRFDKRALLLKNVSNFRFSVTEGAFRIKLCSREKVAFSPSGYITACREKVVY